MTVHHSKYVSVAEAAEHIDHWICNLADIFPEFEGQLKDIPIELRLPYLREPATREHVAKDKVMKAWFHFYARLHYLRETLSMAEDRKILLLTMPDGTAYQEPDQLYFHLGIFCLYLLFASYSPLSSSGQSSRKPSRIMASRTLGWADTSMPLTGFLCLNVMALQAQPVEYLLPFL